MKDKVKSDLAYGAVENEFTAGDLMRLEGDLREILQGRLPKKDHLNVLNMACGRGDETGVLAKLLKEHTKSAQLQGADIRAAEIAAANELWKKKVPQIVDGVEVDFRVQSGDALKDWKEMEGQDMVFMRHQNFWNGRETWRKIFDQALQKLDDEGVFVMTSYFDREHEEARKALKELGAEEVASYSSDRSRKLDDAPDKSVDRHIAVFKKS